MIMHAHVLRWEADFPADIRAIVEPVLEPWRPLFPTWCQELILRFDPKPAARMQAELNHRSRWGVLIVTASWLADPPAQRESSLVHEIVHFALEPLAVAVKAGLDEAIPDADDRARRLAERIVTDALECSVEDLAQGLVRLRR